MLVSRRGVTSDGNRVRVPRGRRLWDEKTVALAASLLMLTALVAVTSLNSQGYVPHPAIRIFGNADFTPANGVVRGSGTPSDPYIIEGWEIDGSANSGIEVYNTDAFFVIRDVYVHSSLIDAIFFYDVKNARVENAVVSQNDAGLYIQVSSNVTVALSNISFNNLDAIVLDWSSNVTVEGNEMWGNGDWGVFTYESDDLMIRNNTVSGNGWAGIELYLAERVAVDGNRVADNNVAGLIVDSSSNVTITDNALPENGYNMDLTDSVDVLIRGNAVAMSSSDGITITGGARLTIEENNITGNGAGVGVVGATGLRVRHNAFIGNVPQAADDAGSENAWDDGYPSGGNYWSDYAGVDDCSGPNQDVCPDPDGIGDTPYMIDADTLDRYPLMQPFEADRPPAAPRLVPAQLTGPGGADVRLEWRPSRDDGGGERDVAGYEIWWGTGHDATGLTYSLLASLPAGTTSYVHSGVGVGDEGNHFYQVRAVEQGSGRFTPAFEQAAKLSQFVPAGKHLVSVPLELADWSVEAVLQTLPWTRVLAFDGTLGDAGEWLSKVPSMAGGSLPTLDRRMGVWLATSADAWWALAGLVPASTQLSLTVGWNLIGYPSLTDRTVGSVLSGVTYEFVEAYADIPPYYLQRLSATSTMSNGNAYWVYVFGSDAVITITN